MTSTRYRVWMYSRPAMCRTYYHGKVDVIADDEEQATEPIRSPSRRGTVEDSVDAVDDNETVDEPGEETEADDLEPITETD